MLAWVLSLLLYRHSVGILMDTHEDLTQHDGGHSGANGAEGRTTAAVVAREDLDEPLPHLLRLYIGQHATRNAQRATHDHGARDR